MSVARPILIAGGGIGGLAVAAVLRQLRLPVRVLERDAAYDAREQGYSLTINHTGIKSLRRLGVSEARLKEVAQPLTNLFFTDSEGRELMTLDATAFAARWNDSTASEGEAPSTADHTAWHERQRYDRYHGRRRDRELRLRVRRADLREMLRELTDGDKQCSIEYGRTVVGYDLDFTGKRVLVDVENARGEVEQIEGSYLIGADGVRSRVRQQMRGGDDLEYAGALHIGSTLRDEATTRRFLEHRLLRDGASFFALTDVGRSFFALPFDKNRLSYSLMLRTDDFQPYEDHMDGKHDAVKQTSVRLTDCFFDLVRDMIAATPAEDLRVRLMRSHPIGARFPAGPVLLMGDAAHSMTPLLGQGANRALRDALYVREFFDQLAEAGALADWRIVTTAASKLNERVQNKARPFVQGSRLMVRLMMPTSSLGLWVRDQALSWAGKALRFGARHSR